MTGLSVSEFDAFWEAFDRKAQEDKFSHQALLRLIAFYRSLDEEDQVVVDERLADWVGSDNVRKRFDALALIDEFGVRSALPALRADLRRLEHAEGPSIPSDRAKLLRIIDKLDAPSSAGS